MIEYLIEEEREEDKEEGKAIDYRIQEKWGKGEEKRAERLK